MVVRARGVLDECGTPRRGRVGGAMVALGAWFSNGRGGERTGETRVFQRGLPEDG